MIAVVAAHNEAGRIGATLAALGEAFPGAAVWVSNDGSDDATAAIARAAGATVVSNGRVGKGAAMTLAVRDALAQAIPARPCDQAGQADGGALIPEPVVLLCDGDLGESAARLTALVEAVREGDADLAVAVFERRVGGGVGVAVAFARWAIRRRCGMASTAPLSGQRALRAGALARLLPFAEGFGMEVGMTIDAARASLRVREIELDLSHRVTGRTPAGFLHRARQLIDCVRAYAARR